MHQSTMSRRLTLTEVALSTVLERARTVGFLGPGPLSVHVDHAAEYERLIPAGVGSLVDIGSGGGVPGLPIAVARPEIDVVLLDAAQRRTSFLVWAVTTLEAHDRVAVVTGRAEDVGHDATYRRSFDVVVSRGFGPPATTLECAAGLVAPGGLILISEPPGGRVWPADGVGQLGLTVHPEHRTGPIAAFVATEELDEQFPREAKPMKRRPLFEL